MLKGAAIVLTGMALLAPVVYVSLVCDFPGSEVSYGRFLYLAPLWSSDGSHIVLSRPPEGVYVVKADGSRIWRLSVSSRIGTTFYPGSFMPTISPDGTQVAFAAFAGEKNNNSSDIFVSGIDGSALRQLTRTRGDDEASPSWSPDGTRIAFIEVGSWVKGSRVYVMDSDGSNRRMLVQTIRARELAPVWSPDGSRIAFVSEVLGREGTSYFVYTVRLDGSGLTNLGRSASRPAWSPDGSRLAFVKEGVERRVLYTMDADGRSQVALPSVRLKYGIDLWYDNLQWSPDGTEILIGLSDPPAGGLHVPVVVAKVDGSGSRVLLERTLGFYSGAASWSPDGSRVSVHAYRPSHLYPRAVLYTVAGDGSDRQLLVREGESDLEAAGPVRMPDGASE